jgi:hypothetical protein
LADESPKAEPIAALTLRPKRRRSERLFFILQDVPFLSGRRTCFPFQAANLPLKWVSLESRDLDQYRTAINYNNLPGTEALLHQVQIGKRDITCLANPANRQTTVLRSRTTLRDHLLLHFRSLGHLMLHFCGRSDTRKAESKWLTTATLCCNWSNYGSNQSRWER